MLIFLDHDLVVLAVPKTGTTALSKNLRGVADIAFPKVRGPNAGKHNSLRQFRKTQEPELIEQGYGPFKFAASFREPVEWLNSWYRFRSRDKLIGHPNSTRDVSFDQFARYFCMKKDRPTMCRGLPPQSFFVVDKSGKVAVEHLFKYDSENTEITKFLSTLLGCDVAPSQVNVSPQSSDHELSDETLALYRETYSLDFKIYESL